MNIGLKIKFISLDVFPGTEYTTTRKTKVGTKKQ
jgi:hypothetical protein